MRIAFVSTMESMPWGGSEELWSQTALYLASKQHQVFASVRKFATVPTSIQELQRKGVVCSFRDPNPNSLARRAWNAFTSPVEWRRRSWERQRWLNRIRPDLVCISDGAVRGSLPWARECQVAGIPFVCVAQANHEGWWPDDRAAEELRQVFKDARRIFFVSRANLELFEVQIASRLQQAEVVWNPYQVPWEVEPNWPQGDAGEMAWTLACVSRIQPAAKGQDLLIRILALPHWRQRNLRIDFVGSGDCEEGMRRLVADAEMGDRFRFLGQVDDLAKVWSDHHGLILGSRYEGLPLAVIEAMLCHRLVIAPSVAGIPEVVTDGVHGFLAEAPTISCLDAAMSRAWEQRDRWKLMGEAAGIAIRKILPRSPAEAFAEKLIAIGRKSAVSLQLA